MKKIDMLEVWLLYSWTPYAIHINVAKSILDLPFSVEAAPKFYIPRFYFFVSYAYLIN